MHLLFENVIPMMIKLWKGKFRDVSCDGQAWVIPEASWEQIGRLTTQSNPSIPAIFA